MQIQKGALIGKGLTSKVYACGEGRVLKLFESWRPAWKAEREFMVTRAVHATGLPVPAAYELVDVEGKRGIVFERIDGPSMFEQVAARPWRLFAAARELAELHAQLHGMTAPEQLPSQHEQIVRWIEAAADFSEARKEEARRCLADLPRGDALCHGDFHPANILMSARGPIIIDWSAATRGNPVGDVARTSQLFETADLPDDAPRHTAMLLRWARSSLHAAYLKRYFQLRPGRHSEIDAWRLPQMAGTSAWKAERT